MSLQQGSEKRQSILETKSPAGIGMLGSSYDFGSAMLTPDKIDVKVGNSMDNVINAVKGVGFYTDMIGFGASSTGLTDGMPIEPLGINYFMNTGQTCSNGATMWKYIEGIPSGNALGEGVKTAMANMGLPPLRGLAPGMLEDMQQALNPKPLMDAMLGSGYPECELIARKVGDAYGRISDPATGELWIEGKVDPGNMQSRWVQRMDGSKKPISLTREEYMATAKTFNPDGTPIKNKTTKDTFEDMMTRSSTIAVVGVLCLLAFHFVKR